MALTALQRLLPITAPLQTDPAVTVDLTGLAPVPSGFIRNIPALSRDSALPTSEELRNIIATAPIIKDTSTFKGFNIWTDLAKFAVFGASGIASSGLSFVGAGVKELSAPEQPSPINSVTINREVQPMAFFDDIGSFFDSGSSGTSFDWNNLLNLGVGLATNALAPQRSVVSMAPASMAAVPAIAGAGRAVATVGRSLFNRFPNLATGIQRLRNAGQKINRAKLYSVMKRFGPEFLVSGGLLTAAAVQELAVAGPGRRRMNPANARALRRSVRRIESFHRLCKSTDILHTKVRRKR